MILAHNSLSKAWSERNHHGEFINDQPVFPWRTSNTMLGIPPGSSMIELQLTMSRWSCGSGAFLLSYSAFRQGTLVHIFDTSSSVRKAVVFQKIKMIVTKLMSPKDSDNLSGAHFTPASIRRALKGKILFMRCVKNPQIEFRIVANLRPHLTSSDLT